MARYLLDTNTVSYLADTASPFHAVVGAERFGRLMRGLRGGLARRAAQRHAIDCMIAVTALERGAVLVSNDGLFAHLATLDRALQAIDWTNG